MLFIKNFQKITTIVLVAMLAFLLAASVIFGENSSGNNVATVGAGDVEGQIVATEKAKFADTIDHETLAKQAKYIPKTTIVELRAEAEREKTMSEEEKAKRDEMFALIGTIGVVNVSNSLNVRETTDSESEIVGKLYQNTGVIIGNFAGEEYEWMYIQSGTTQGWVQSSFIATGEQADSLYRAMEPSVATMVTDANSYEEASSDSNVCMPLEEGMQFPVLEVVGDFVKVQLTSYATGYISAFDISVDKGLGTGVSNDEDENKQIQIEVLIEERRIMAEQQKAEEEAAAEAARIAAEAARARSSRSSSSGNSYGAAYGNGGGSSSEGWTYLGKFRVTFYCKESCGGNTRTASGATAQEGYTCATSSQISFGSTVKVDGYGTWVVQDRGVGTNQIDLYVYASQASGLYYRDVWVKN